MDFVQSKDELIEELRIGGIKDEKVLEAIKLVPREYFVSSKFKKYAYTNKALPIAKRQTISQPLVVALMTSALEPDLSDKVLEIGTGSGYQAAVLSGMVKKIITIEFFKHLSNLTKKRLEKLGFENIYFIVGDGRRGFEQEAPYDKIIITAASDQVPKTLVNQLKTNGILVAPIGEAIEQKLLKFKKINQHLIQVEDLGSCQFVPLLGKPRFGTVN